MKVIIAGSRRLENALKQVTTAIDLAPFTISEVVCGMARGADQAGEEWAKLHHIPIKLFPADWKGHGPAAGPLRNKQMAEYGDALIAVWDGESRGTQHMIRMAKERNLPIYLHIVPPFDFPLTNPGNIQCSFHYGVPGFS